MSEDNGSWQFQASFRLVGDVLLNVRALNSEEFEANLNAAIASAALKDAQAFFAPQKPAYAPPASAPPAATRQPYSAPQRTVGAETGPVQITGFEATATKRDGTPMRSPKFTVAFSNGKKLSTFDATLADAAKNLWNSGTSVYYGVETKGEFQNLGSIRSAL